MDDRKLYAAAEKQMEFAYAPYSNFRVGAALLTKEGIIFGGCNVESASYGATICAERTALVKAVSEGKQDFSTLAISGSSGEFTYPCGICRQLLYEFNPDLQIIVGNKKGEIKKHTLRELLPYGFNKEELPK